MALKVWSVDGQEGEVNLEHLQIRTAQFVMADPAADVYPLHRVPVAGTVRAVRAYRVGGTGAVVAATKNATALLSANKSLTSADQWMAGALSAVAGALTLAVGDTLSIEIVSVAGAPTCLTVQIDYEIADPE